MGVGARRVTASSKTQRAQLCTRVVAIGSLVLPEGQVVALLQSWMLQWILELINLILHRCTLSMVVSNVNLSLNSLAFFLCSEVFINLLPLQLEQLQALRQSHLDTILGFSIQHGHQSHNPKQKCIQSYNNNLTSRFQVADSSLSN